MLWSKVQRCHCGVFSVVKIILRAAQSTRHVRADVRHRRSDVRLHAILPGHCRRNSSSFGIDKVASMGMASSIQRMRSPSAPHLEMR